MFRRKRKFASGNSGCGYMLMTGLLICALLLINALLVKAFVLTSNLERLDVRINQAAQFVLPILMIFAEFWVFDLMTAKRNNRRTEQSKAE